MIKKKYFISSRCPFTPQPMLKEIWKAIYINTYRINNFKIFLFSFLTLKRIFELEMKSVPKYSQNSRIVTSKSLDLTEELQSSSYLCSQMQTYRHIILPLVLIFNFFTQFNEHCRTVERTFIIKNIQSV